MKVGGQHAFAFKLNFDQQARMRLDKWLWAARFYKTRSLAAKAIEKGQVRLNQQIVKSGKEIKIEDRVEIKINRVVWQCIVLALIEFRGPSSLAKQLYQETEEGRLARLAQQEQHRLFKEPAAHLQGRPTKKDRRQLKQITNKY